METVRPKSVSGNKTSRWVFVLTLVVMAFTGFGQMPIFKRYYISDIPGMGWSADFYLTHYIHYLGAGLLFALFAYFVFDYILIGKQKFRLTSSAFVRIVLLAGIAATGIFRVLKNLPHVVFSPGFTVLIDIAHLGFVILYLLTALVFLISGSKWLVRKTT